MPMDLITDNIVQRPENVKETSDQGFEKDVIAGSMKAPVVVEFYSPLNMQCKQFSTVVEKLVAATNGKVSMFKVSMDKNPVLIDALQIQNVPTIYAFFQGRAVDGFAGIRSEHEVKKFVDSLVALTGDAPAAGGLSEEERQKIKATADKFFFEAQYEQAFESYAQLLEENGTGNTEALGAMGWCQFMRKDMDGVEEILESMTDDARITPKVKGLIFVKELFDEYKKADIAALKTKAEKGTSADKFKLASAYTAKGEFEEVITVLLAIIQKDRAWQDGKAKDFLIQIFEALGASNPLVIKGKRRLSSVLFS